ncbi:MAG TPA: DivIVA domain-containing protein [Actinomycetota bacterium]|nr:DivIVA domain-containing protein [Actinomycetota bacterium]
MSTDLDLPVLMNPDHIRRREFVAIRRGYDPAQVREFLERVADQVQEMQDLIRDARLEADAATRAASPRVDPYATLAERIAGVIKAADDEAERSRRGAAAEAEQIVAEARAVAERLRVDAEADAAETRATAEAELRDAREQAHRAIASLSTRREILIEELASMQERLVGVARDLGSTISHPEPADVEPMDAESEAFLARSRSEAFAPQTEQPVEPPEQPAAGAVERPAIEGEEPPADEATERPDGSDRTIVLGEASTEADEGPPGEPEGSGTAEPSFEGVWAGAETSPLDLPDLPPLDLDWGEDEEEPDPDAE